MPRRARTRFAPAFLRRPRNTTFPVREEGIQVHRQGSQFNGTITIHVPYIVHIDFPGYPVDLNFDASTENRSVF